MAAPETIAAVATPPGFGGVGILRVSGPLAAKIARQVLGRVPEPRVATFTNFCGPGDIPIDQGIALFFPSPRSFTGEDVLELQGHGGPVVMDMLLRRTLELGARLARPGEFSERAFLNGKLDLAQAEAVADLIQSRTEAAVRLAARTLRGDFSRRVYALVDALIHLRAFVEAAMDFPDEDVDFLADSEVSSGLHALIAQTLALMASAHQGQLIREGLRLVIAGPPNAGKSSLLNALSGTEVAIVTDIPGTTRDLLRQEIQIDGMPLHIVDTAGLRPAADVIEEEGIRRTWEQIRQADRVLWVYDASVDPRHDGFDPTPFPTDIPLTFIRNKIDLTNEPPGCGPTEAGIEVSLSVRTGSGMNALREHLKGIAGFHGAGEGEFIARRRHLDALARALAYLESAVEVRTQTAAGELMAEDLRLAQQAFGEITGAFTSDDLLGRIFAGFCIGK